MVHAYRFRKVKKGYLTYAQALTETQASEVELTKALKDRRILLINGNPLFQSRQCLRPEIVALIGTLRPIAASYLSAILELILNSLVSLQQVNDSASVKLLVGALQDDHDVRPQVTRQVMGWFGDVDAHQWKMDVPSVLKQVGMGILRVYRVRRIICRPLNSLTVYKHDSIDEKEFLDKWKNAVGDTFASQVDLSLLSVRRSPAIVTQCIADGGKQGNYIVSTKPQSQPTSNQLTYFPSSELPLDPFARFSDLFLTRSRWRAEEIGPFLNDIAIDRKERDKLLLKYARAVTTPDGIYYTARTIK